MEPTDRQVSLFGRSGPASSQTSQPGRSNVKIDCLMTILLLVGAPVSGPPDSTLMKALGFGIAHGTVATAGPAMNAQI